MADTTTILLSFIGFGITLVTFILGYIVKELKDIKREEIRPMRGRIDTLWNSFFGVEAEGEKVVDGHLEQSDEARSSMRKMLEDADEDRERLFRGVAGVSEYLRDLGDVLHEELDTEVPHIEEDDYVTTFEDEDTDRWRSDDD